MTRYATFRGQAGTLLAFALVVLASPLASQEPTDTVPAYVLPGVTVTSPRTRVRADRLSQRTDVLAGADLARMAAGNVGEALRSAVAVDMIEYAGLLTGVAIRGFRPQFNGMNPRTLILVDGRPAGTNNLALLDLGGVERVEVLRGPASALYGSSAMGGVVNVVTRRSVGALSGTASGRYGSFGEYEGLLSVGGDVAAGVDFDLTLTADGRRSGFSTGSRRTFASDSLIKRLPGGSTVRLPLNDPDAQVAFAEFTSRSGSARLGYAFADAWRIDVRGERFAGDDVQNPGDMNVVDYDSRSLKDVDRHSLDVALSGSLTRSAPLLRFYSTRETVDYFDLPEPPHFVNFRTPSRTYGAQLQNTLRMGVHELVAGLDHTSVVAESQAFTAAGVRGSPYSPDAAIRSTAAFGQLRLALLDERLTLAGGARLDRILFEVRETPNLGGFTPGSDRHLAFTPSAGIVYSGSGVRLYGNIGRAFVTPEPFHVAGYSESRAGAERRAVTVTRGNRDLRPESSVSWDAGIALASSTSPFTVDVAYFHTDVRDRITQERLEVGGDEVTAAGDTIIFATSYRNADEARVRGIEADLAFDLGSALDARSSFRLFATGTRIIDATEHFVSMGSSQRIRNVADLTVVAGVDYDDRRRFDARFAGRYVGERVDDDFVDYTTPGEILYPAYLVLDLTAGARIGERYRVGVELRNLGDEDYFEVRGYNLPGRSLRVVASANF